MGKVVHGEGSWGKGIKVIEQVMDDLDADTDTMLLRDGSGMSHKNMIPSEELLQVLYQAQKQDIIDGAVFELQNEAGKMLQEGLTTDKDGNLG